MRNLKEEVRTAVYKTLHEKTAVDDDHVPHLADVIARQVDSKFKDNGKPRGWFTRMWRHLFN